MRTLAIGDIHGCSRALDHILAAIGPRKNDLIVTLGDYVDRGPDSSGVIERLLTLRDRVNLVSLRGNHEELMLMARQGEDRLTEWCHGGGQATLNSYGRDGEPGTLADIPATHWDFLKNFCREYYETDTHLFVHAGVDPDLPMEQQPNFVLQWVRFDDPKPHISGKTVVCGHTPQKSGSPKNDGHCICIDTGAFRKGWLTCLEITTGYVWQATQTGELRSGYLSEFPARTGVTVT